MSDRISTKAGVFESGDKDAMGVQYKDDRLIACRNPKLTDYAVADGTEVICDRAFMNMKELKSIKLPASLRAIGESVFSGCRSLVDITIPDGVTEIRQATFRDCDALAAIELPASVTEIEKFAFGRGLTTLGVNAPEMKIDRYAFMNARDFSTLMVPAGTADYYRDLLSEMRVKADVEEREETEELFSSNNMEEDKKMKTVKVEVSGIELFLEPTDPNEEEVYDAYSRFATDSLVISVNGKQYKPIYLGLEYNVLSQEQLEEFKSFNVAEFFEKSGAREGMLYKNKAYTAIEIEMAEDEEFDPNKATIVSRGFKYPDDEIDPTVCAFGYDGIVYDCSPEDSNGISGKKIWSCGNDTETDDNGEPEEEADEKTDSKSVSGLQNDNPGNLKYRDLEYIKTLVIYANEVDPYDEEDEESYYESWFKIGENYSDEQIQSAIDSIDEDETGDDFWHTLVVNLGEIDWNGIFENVTYIKITDSNNNTLFEED